MNTCYKLYTLLLLFSFFSCTKILAEESSTLSLSGDITSSSDAGKKYNAAKAADNNWDSYWKAKDKNTPQFLLVDLKGNFYLDKVSQTFAQSGTWKFKIEGSTDNKNWLMLSDKTKGIAGITFAESVNGTYRYVKLTVIESPENAFPSSKEFIITGSDKGINLAEGKRFINTVCTHNFEPEKAADGNLSSYWVAPNGSFPQSITLDLDSSCPVTGVQQLFKDYDQWKFKIEASNDQLKWDMLMDKTSGDNGFDFKSEVSGKYRYFKLTVLGSASGFWAHSCEFKVFGVENRTQGQTAISNLSQHTTATASSFINNLYCQDNALDGNTETSWIANDGTLPQWLTVDLGNPCDISSFKQEFVNEDVWSFKMEGSNDNKNWKLLADKTSGYAGKSFAGNITGTYRYIRMTVLNAANGSWAGSRQFDILGTGSPKRSSWWENVSGMTRYYPKVYKQTLNSITDSLDIIKAQGYQIIEMSAPYEGNPEVWGGLGATNNYAIDPSIGTMADFERLIAEAHARDIKIVIFGNVGYCWYEAPFFQKACEDERNNIDSKERKWFHFSKTKQGDKWFWSEQAQSYYYSAWGDSDGANGRIPSYNFNNQEWREECRNYLNFWSDKGIDGLLLDAPPAYDGITDAITEEYIIKVLNRRGILTNAEGSSDIPLWIGKFRFKCIQGFDMYGWGGGKRSEALAAMRAQNPSGLNDKLKNYRDQAVALDAITVTPPMWEIPATNSERIFELAYLSTSGTIVVNHYGDHHREYIAQFILSKWPKADQEKFYNLIRTQNSYPALAPMGQRTSLPTNNDSKYAAFKRSNKDGKVSALVVMNFQNSEEKITVNLKNSGISVGQVPVNLLNATAAPAIFSDNYEVMLPPFGYLILGVD